MPPLPNNANFPGTVIVLMGQFEAYGFQFCVSGWVPK